MFLSGFYGISIFPFLKFFLDEGRVVREPWFFSNIPACAAPALETLFILVQLLLTQHSNQTSTVYWTMRCQVTHSLSYSHKPTSPLPSVPFAVFANAISLSKPNEETYDHLNKHRHSMASLCGCGAGFPLCGECVCAYASAHVCVSLCTDIIAVGFWYTRSACVFRSV